MTLFGLIGYVNNVSGQTASNGNCGATGPSGPSGDCNFAAGTGSEVTGDGAVAVSSGHASGESSFAGSGGNASGDRSTALSGASASGADSFAAAKADAQGAAASALGNRAWAKGDNSIAIGREIEASSTANHNFVIGRGGSGFLQNDITNSLMIGFNSSEPTMFVEGAPGSGDDYGQVGIGTTDPDGILHLYNSTASQNTDLVIDKLTSQAGRILFHDAGTEAANLRLNSTDDLVMEHDVSNEDIVFKVNDGGVDTEVMRIVGATTNVGIGTSSPGAKLHVDAAADASNHEELAQFTVNDAATQSLCIRNRSLDATEFAPWIEGISNVSDNSPLELTGRIEGSANTGTTPVMVFDARVGSGSTAPVRPLFRWRTNAATSLMQMDQNGNLGIGTSTPDGLLHLYAPASTDTDLILENQSGEDARIRFFTGSTEDGQIMMDNGNTMRIKNKSTDEDIVISINDNGDQFNAVTIDGSRSNVGIGTGSPDARLDVLGLDDQGASEILGQYATFDADDANNYFRIQNESGTNGDFGVMLKAKNNTHDDRPVMMIKAVAAANSTSSTTSILQFDSRYDGTGTNPRALFSWTENNNGATKMIMDKDGNLGLGTNTPTALLEIGADDACKPSTSTWQICSDENLKTDISEFQDGLDVLTQINPVWFRYNGLGYLPTDNMEVGILAQEIQEVAPYMISDSHIVLDSLTQETMPVLKYNANALFYITVNAIKELDARTQSIDQATESIQTLSDSVTSLASRLDELNNRMSSCCSAVDPSFRSASMLSDYSRKESFIEVVPNPFSDHATIRYELSKSPVNAKMVIVDSGGAEVYSIPVRNSKGQVFVTAEDLSPGTYYCSLISDTELISTILVHIK